MEVLCVSTPSYKEEATQLAMISFEGDFWGKCGKERPIRLNEISDEFQETDQSTHNLSLASTRRVIRPLFCGDHKEEKKKKILPFLFVADSILFYLYSRDAEELERPKRGEKIIIILKRSSKSWTLFDHDLLWKDIKSMTNDSNKMIHQKKMIIMIKIGGKHSYI